MKYISLKLSVLCFGLFVSFAPSFALMQASNYPTFEAFQSSGDAPICKVVTDGCNEWYFQDGEKGDPIKACKLTADFEYSWSCAQLNEGIMTILGNTAEESVGDMMYIDPLTTEERSSYNEMMSELTEKEFAKISRVTEKYALLRSNYPEKQQEKYKARIQAAIQKHIDIRVKKENASTDRVLLMLQYLKLEIKVMSQNMPIGGMVPLSGEVYTCAASEYRVYDEDYLIDDMAFQVAQDEIHVSDGTFLLPNFVATQGVSASGVKYTGKNTETQEVYSFWFKADEMSVYKGETLLHTCMKK